MEDSDPPAATLTRRQEKQSKSRLEDPVVDGETKELEDQAGKLLKKSSAEDKKTAENDEAERISSKTTVGTKEKQESKPSMYAKTTTTELTEKIPSEGGSKTAGQTDAQKAAAARKLLPEVQSKASGVNEMNPQPETDPQPI